MARATFRVARSKMTTLIKMKNAARVPNPKIIEQKKEKRSLCSYAGAYAHCWVK